MKEGKKKYKSERCDYVFSAKELVDAVLDAYEKGRRDNDSFINRYFNLELKTREEFNKKASI